MSGVSDLYREGRGKGSNPLAVQMGLLRLPLDGNTVGLWHFLEGAGTSLADKATTPHNITLYGNPAWLAGERYAEQLTLDGVDDYGTLASQASLIAGLTNFSVEVILKSSVADNSGTNDAIYSEGRPNVVFAFVRALNKLDITWQYGTSWFDLKSTNDISSWTSWHYLALTKAGLIATLYDAGVPVGSATAAGAPNACTASEFFRYYDGATWDGAFTVACLRLSNVARSATELLANAKLVGFA